MIEVRMTPVFQTWLHGLRDVQARARIQSRILRIADGNPGQHRNLTGGVSEMKIDYGPGYRVYYTKRGNTLIMLLCGGDKSTQAQDIAAAARLINELVGESEV